MGVEQWLIRHKSFGRLMTQEIGEAGSPEELWVTELAPPIRICICRLCRPRFSDRIQNFGKSKFSPRGGALSLFPSSPVLHHARSSKKLFFSLDHAAHVKVTHCFTMQVLV